MTHGLTSYARTSAHNPLSQPRVCGLGSPYAALQDPPDPVPLSSPGSPGQKQADMRGRPRMYGPRGWSSARSWIPQPQVPHPRPELGTPRSDAQNSDSEGSTTTDAFQTLIFTPKNSYIEPLTSSTDHFPSVVKMTKKNTKTPSTEVRTPGVEFFKLIKFRHRGQDLGDRIL